MYSAPKTKVPLSPGWNFGAECNQPWATPPKTCTEYPGQRAGAFDYSKAYPNLAGRTDVEGCCWWGRGVIQLTGKFGTRQFAHNHNRFKLTRSTLVRTVQCWKAQLFLGESRQRSRTSGCSIP